MKVNFFFFQSIDRADGGFDRKHVSTSGNLTKYWKQRKTCCDFYILKSVNNGLTLSHNVVLSGCKPFWKSGGWWGRISQGLFRRQELSEEKKHCTIVWFKDIKQEIWVKQMFNIEISDKRCLNIRFPSLHLYVYRIYIYLNIGHIRWRVPVYIYAYIWMYKKADRDILIKLGDGIFEIPCRKVSNHQLKTLSAWSPLSTCTY